MRLFPLRLSGLLSALAGAAFAQAPGTERVPDSLDFAVGHELSTPEADTRSERLVRLGPEAIPALFEALVTRRAPHREGHDAPLEWLELDPSQASEVRHALGMEPAQPLLDFLRRVDGDEARRLTVLGLLGKVGEPRDLPHLVWLLDEGQTRIARARRDDLQEAFESILERHAAAREEVLRAYRSAPDALLAGIIWAVSGETSEQRLWILTGLLGGNPEADPLILAELARMGRRLPHPMAEAVLSVTRDYLQSGEPEMLLSGIEVADSLEDVEALPILIDLLGHSSRAVSERALAALRSTTNLGYSGDPRRWQEWQRKAEEWRRGTAPKLLENVANGVPGRAANALMEISKWRVFRHELADGVADGLEREETELVVLACSVLGHLGSWRAVPALTERLKDPAPAVQRAALLALRSITRVDAGSDPAAWRRLAKGALQSPTSPAR
ncbi:MAG: HEAT repeat domain-containing protein [Planctomycetes bacterium]|nr:HEAT repeat domain-containing protein [Planctomycetota bacterium]